MNGKKIISDIFKVTLSNISTLISGIFVGFIIPKVLGVNEYGYYKIFTLYATYIGLFSFGISEGIYLKYSGIAYCDLNKERIRFFTKLVMKIQISVAIIMMVFSAFFLHEEYKFITMALAIYLIEMNLTSFYQYIAQMTLRFNDYAIRNFLKTILTILAVIVMVLIYLKNGNDSVSYKVYVFLTLLISTFLYFMYLKKFKDITMGDSDSIAECKDEIKEITRLGIPFLFASMCSTLILNIDKQFVAILFEPSIYGMYAFAYSLLTLVTLCTSAISTVLYPTLKKVSKENLSENFDMLSSLILVFVFFMMIAYYPLTLVVKWFLPKYVNSLDIFRIVFPGLAFTSIISVVYQNFYKLLDKNYLFLKQNIFILILSIIANFIAYKIFRTPSAISYASIVILFIYYNISESYFRNNFNIKWKKNIIYITYLMLGFYAITRISNIYISMLLYLLYFIIATKIVMPETIVSLKKIIEKKRG